MATREQRVHLVEAVIGTQQIAGRPMRIVSGLLVPRYFPALVIPDYQRRALEHHKHEALKEVLRPDGWGIPDDLTLCHREATARVTGANEVVLLTTMGLIVLDGHQRHYAGMARLSQKLPTLPERVKVLLGTTPDEEVKLFYQMNREQTKVITHVFLRNERQHSSNSTIEKLFEMALTTEGFPTVQLDHDRPKEEHITAHMLMEVAILLHGGGLGKEVQDIAATVGTIGKKIGDAVVAHNVQYFFAVIKQAFGGDKRKSMYRVDLLRATARIFSQYADFWDSRRPNTLLVKAPDLKKLSTYKKKNLENDLARSSATATLVHGLTIHIHSNNRAHLVQRPRWEY